MVGDADTDGLVLKASGAEGGDLDVIDVKVEGGGGVIEGVDLVLKVDGARDDVAGREQEVVLATVVSRDKLVVTDPSLSGKDVGHSGPVVVDNASSDRVVTGFSVDTSVEVGVEPRSRRAVGRDLEAGHLDGGREGTAVVAALGVVLPEEDLGAGVVVSTIRDQERKVVRRADGASVQ